MPFWTLASSARAMALSLVIHALPSSHWRESATVFQSFRTRRMNFDESPTLFRLPSLKGFRTASAVAKKKKDAEES